MTDDDPEILTAKGVASDVMDHGHVLLLDYDDAHRDMMDYAINLPGVTFVFESSPGKYHAWNLTVRDIEDTALAHLRSKADPMHASIGLRRGRWTVRWGPKMPANAGAGFTDEGGPEPYNYWINETDEPQSSPHLRLALTKFRHHYDTETITERANDRCPNWVEGDWRAEEYLTY